MRFKSLFMTAVALATVLALAAPASAHNDVVVGTGVATVCAYTDTAPPGCPGLGLPLTNDQYASWTITATGEGLYTWDLSASGHLVGGCGLSTGTGAGTATADGAQHGIVVYWPSSAGTFLPIEGRYAGIGNHYKDLTPLEPLELNETGVISGVVQAIAQGALEACQGKNATNFDVTIAVSLIDP